MAVGPSCTPLTRTHTPGVLPTCAIRSATHAFHHNLHKQSPTTSQLGGVWLPATGTRTTTITTTTTTRRTKRWVVLWFGCDVGCLTLETALKCSRGDVQHSMSSTPCTYQKRAALLHVHISHTPYHHAALHQASSLQQPVLCALACTDSHCLRHLQSNLAWRASRLRGTYPDVANRLPCPFRPEGA